MLIEPWPVGVHVLHVLLKTLGVATTSVPEPHSAKGSLKAIPFRAARRRAGRVVICEREARGSAKGNRAGANDL